MDAPYNMVANTRQVANPSSTDEHNRVFLEVMTFSWDVGDHLLSCR